MATTQVNNRALLRGGVLLGVGVTTLLLAWTLFVGNYAPGGFGDHPMCDDDPSAEPVACWNQERLGRAEAQLEDIVGAWTIFAVAAWITTIAVAMLALAPRGK